MECPKCHLDNQLSAKFCRGCGQRLAQPAVPPAAPPPVQPAAPPVPTASAPQVACVQCGNLLRPGARFCAKCGAARPGGTQPPVIPPEPSPVAFPQAQAQPGAPAPSGYPSPLPPQPTPPVAPISPPGPAGKTPRAPWRPSGYMLRHAAILGALCIGLAFALTAALAYDLDQPAPTPAPPPEITPPVAVPAPLPTADYRAAVIEVRSDGLGRFGLTSITGDPASGQDDGKLLTYSASGDTNNTRVWIDGDTSIYGESGVFGFGGGQFAEDPHWVGGELRSIWKMSDLEVLQTVSYANGSNTGRVDTARIRYVLTNQGSRTHEVGLRIMLDTLIGDNDGVPFVVPGRTGITDRAVRLRGADVPDFVQALEFANLVNPGVIVNLTLRGADTTPPDEVVISAWCSEDAEWDYYASLGGDGHPLDRCGRQGGEPDSAIGLYYAPQSLGPGESREIIAYYGLGGISSTESGNVQLSLTFNRNVQQGDTFWVTALATLPKSGQTLKLELPAGLLLAAGHQAEQALPAGGDYTQVSWQVVADQRLTGARIVVRLLPDDVSESQTITVQPRGLTR